MTKCYVCNEPLMYGYITVAPTGDMDHRRHYGWCPRDEVGRQVFVKNFMRALYPEDKERV